MAFLSLGLWEGANLGFVDAWNLQDISCPFSLACSQSERGSLLTFSWVGLWLLLPVKTVSSMHLSLHSVTPIFTLSSVSGESLDLLKVFLNILPPLTNSKEQEELMQQLTEFQVDEIYTVPEVGTVVGGTLSR